MIEHSHPLGPKSQYFDYVNKNQFPMIIGTYGIESVQCKLFLKNKYNAFEAVVSGPAC